jgi:hypothetical protein
LNHYFCKATEKHGANTGKRLQGKGFRSQLGEFFGLSFLPSGVLFDGVGSRRLLQLVPAQV